MDNERFTRPSLQPVGYFFFLFSNACFFGFVSSWANDHLIQVANDIGVFGTEETHFYRANRHNLNMTDTDRDRFNRLNRNLLFALDNEVKRTTNHCLLI